MGRRDRYAPGLFCWVDGNMADPAAGQAFYSSLFGWEAEERMPGMYWFERLDGAAVCGLGALMDEQRAAGVPSHWMSYVSIEDAAATCDRARELGGGVVVGPLHIEGSGHMALLTDPQGATFGIWQADPFAGAEVVNVPGGFSWNDLQTTVDPTEAAPFYGDLFGWSFEAEPSAPGGYLSIVNGGWGNGGIMRSPVPDAPASWNVYFGVEDIEASLERVKSLGGQVLVGATPVYETGRFAVCTDPQGAVFSLFAGHFDD
ncbi:MAG: VOC family protein [Solirubrobacterales bacterium]|nr:VOC family protein [Solirubrobacterales bacterium]